jgi:hypothetical protein
MAMDMFRIIFGLLLLGTFSMSAQAATVNINPGVCILGTNCWTSTNQYNDQDPDVEYFGVVPGLPLSPNPLVDLDLLYKDDPEDGEEGSLQGYYSTLFQQDGTSGKVGDYSGAVISHNGGLKIDCKAPCYLTVKDGKHDPGRYLFDLATFGWDGEMELNLSDFWEGQGAISHVAIYGNVSAIPVPAAVWLFGTALIGFVGMSRRTTV